MSPFLPILCRATILAALSIGSWSGAGSAQGPKAPELQIEAGRAQHELTVAENVLRDTRAAREKTEAAVAQRLARLEEQRRNAAEQPDPTRRQAALRAIDADRTRARAELADARAAEEAAERNVEAAALALARARTAASESSSKHAPNGATRRTKIEGRGDSKVGPPTGGTASAPKSKAPTAKPDTAPAKSTPVTAVAPAPAPVVSPEDLINVRIEVEAAEAAHERAKVARAEIERKAGDAVRDLARRLADAAELRKRAGDGLQAAEAASLEARLKTLIQEETAKAREAEAREAEALARLEAARAREARVRAEIEARLPSKR